MKRTLISLLVVGLACSPAFGDLFYGLSPDPGGGVYAVDTATAAATLLFSPGPSWYGATDGITPTTIFATPLGGSLYVVDVVAGSATAAPQPYGYSIKELAYDESTGTLFGTDYQHLYWINMTTGVATQIGAHGIPNAVWALDYDASIGQLVGVNQSDNTTYYFNRATGWATAVGPTGQNFITDVWYNPVNGLMWGVGNRPNTLYSINSTTGAATVAGGLGVQLLGMGVPIPAPGAALLGILGIGIVAALRRRL